MENLEDNIEPSLEKMNELADRLEEMHVSAKKGRDIPYVKEIIMYLRKGDFESARTRANTDWDKIRNFPEIEDFLRKEGFDWLS